MLIEFSVTNFISIRETQVLSMVSGKLSDELQNRDFKIPNSESLANLNLLTSSVIYGANAAGKSNLLKAIDAMHDIVLFSAGSRQRGESLEVIPFKLDSAYKNAPSEFEVLIAIDGIKYQYGFSATQQRIIDEWLIAYPKKRPQLWFSREWSNNDNEYEWNFGSNLLGQKQTWKDSTRDNALFLSTAVQLNSEQLKPIFDWFSKTLHFIGVGGISDGYSAHKCTEGYREKILNFLKNAGIGIDDINVEKDKFNPDKMLSPETPDEIKKLLIEEMKDETLYRVSTTHLNNEGKPETFKLSEESTGTRKLFAFSAPWIEVLENGNILVVDELHDNLHPKLVKYLVNLFHNPKINKNNAQLIFTTHETSILNQKIFRRDQVWFCEKGENNNTEVYPLVKFKPRKGREDLEATYLAGGYGAIPYTKD
mgnify:CR=1 FL=1